MRVKIKKKRFLLLSLLMFALTILPNLITVYFFGKGAPNKKILAHDEEKTLKGKSFLA
jgi:hypothetical protein